MTVNELSQRQPIILTTREMKVIEMLRSALKVGWGSVNVEIRGREIVMLSTTLNTKLD